MSPLVRTGLCIWEGNWTLWDRRNALWLSYVMKCCIIYCISPYHGQWSTVLKCCFHQHLIKLIAIGPILCCHGLCNHTVVSESWVIQQKIRATNLLRYPVDYLKSELSFLILFRCFKEWNECSSVSIEEECVLHINCLLHLYGATISITVRGFCNRPNRPSRHEVLSTFLLLKINCIPINR